MPTKTVAINRVEGPNDYGFYDVYDQPGVKYGTREAELAQQAESYVGQIVQLTYDEKSVSSKDGQRTFINRYLTGVAPHQGALPEAVSGAPVASQGHLVSAQLPAIQIMRMKALEIGADLTLGLPVSERLEATVRTADALMEDILRAEDVWRQP